jgi:hypothetical protein
MMVAPPLAGFFLLLMALTLLILVVARGRLGVPSGEAQA